MYFTWKNIKFFNAINWNLYCKNNWFPRSYEKHWFLIVPLLSWLPYTISGMANVKLAFLANFCTCGRTPKVALTSFGKTLRLGFCVSNFLSILSDFFSREKMAQKRLEPKPEQFTKLHFLSYKIDQKQQLPSAKCIEFHGSYRGS